MIQVAIKFRHEEDVSRLVETVSSYPYHMDLTSGKRVVDAKSLLGVFSISNADGLKLSIYEDLSQIDPSFMDAIKPFASCDLDVSVREIS